MENLSCSSDILNLCRFCLSSSELQCFENLEKHLLKLLGDIECDAILDDSFPRKICEKCIIELKSMHSFIEKFHKSTAVLLDLVEGSRLELKEVNEIDESLVDDEHSNSSDESVNHLITDSRKKNGYNGAKSETESSVNNISQMEINFEHRENGQNTDEDCGEEMNEDMAEDYTDYSEDDYHPPEKVVDDPGVIEVYLQTCEIEVIGCYVCGETFKHMRYLQNHFQIENCSPRQYYCSICCENFPNSDLMKIHLMMQHDGIGANYKCQICSDTFDHLFLIKRHEKIHRNNKPHICALCSQGFLDRKSLENHVRTHPCTQMFQCKYCSETFQHKSLWREHLQTHVQGLTDEGSLPNNHPSILPHSSHDQIENHVCKICAIVFPDREQFYAHIDAHADNGTFQCSECEKQFTTRPLLLTHLDAHHMQTNIYDCTECDKKFCDSSSYRRHITTHMGFKKYRCGLCAKTFTHNQHLTIHLKMHKSEETFACSYCQKVFGHKTSLEIHKRTHTREQL